MLKTYLYIPDHINEQITYQARLQKKSKAEVIRDALEAGLTDSREQNDAQVLLDLSKKIRETLKDESLPSDLSVNHDYYLWGGKKKNTNVKT